MFKTQHKVLFVVLTALAPIITLLIRGVVWGSDSFAYWAVSCGNFGVISFLHSPDFFYFFLNNVVGCDLYRLAFLMFVFYLFALVSFWIIGKRFFGAEGWRLPVYIGALTPLFFIEVLRLEPQFFGWVFGFVGLGLFVLLFNDFSKIIKVFVLILMVLLWFFSVFLWLPSVLIVLSCVLFTRLGFKAKQSIIILAITLIAILQLPYLLTSIQLTTTVTEEMPIIGIIFIIHIIHFHKKIPKDFKLYGQTMIIIGLIKLKYMFLATPLLLTGLLDKQLKEKITLKRTILGIKEIPILYICSILLIGWMITGITLSPTQKDINELQQLITKAKNENIQLYNDWGNGWLITNLGYDTNYKAEANQPDWNNLPRPYIAYTITELKNCEKISKKSWYCYKQ